jgi:hypothetical protein
MVEYIAVSGKTTKWMAAVFSHGLMDVGMKVNISMIKKKEEASFIGKLFLYF